MWAEMKVYYEMGRKPGLPFDVEEYREKAVRLASDLDNFEDDVREIFLMLATKHASTDFKELFNQLNYEKTRAREGIIKRIHKELGGTGELKRGWYMKRDHLGVEHKDSGRYFDITTIKPPKKEEIVEETDEKHKKPHKPDFSGFDYS